MQNLRERGLLVEAIARNDYKTTPAVDGLNRIWLSVTPPEGDNDFLETL